MTTHLRSLVLHWGTVWRCQNWTWRFGTEPRREESSRGVSPQHLTMADDTVGHTCPARRPCMCSSAAHLGIFAGLWHCQFLKCWQGTGLMWWCLLIPCHVWSERKAWREKAKASTVPFMDHLSQLGTSPSALLLHPKANTALVSQAKGKGWVSACSYTELGHSLQDEKLFTSFRCSPSSDFRCLDIYFWVLTDNIWAGGCQVMFSLLSAK